MKLKYMLAAGMMAAMTTGCNESSFLDLKPQGALNEDLLNSKEGIELLITSAYSALQTMLIKVVAASLMVAILIRWKLL